MIYPLERKDRKSLRDVLEKNAKVTFHDCDCDCDCDCNSDLWLVFSYIIQTFWLRTSALAVHGWIMRKLEIALQI